MNLFRIKGDTVQNFVDGQNRERPEMIRRQNQRNGKRREDGELQRFAGQGYQCHCPHVPETDSCRASIRQGFSDPRQAGAGHGVVSF